jgi:hypothetical protein
MSVSYIRLFSIMVLEKINSKTKADLYYRNNFFLDHPIITAYLILTSLYRRLSIQILRQIFPLRDCTSQLTSFIGNTAIAFLII